LNQNQCNELQVESYSEDLQQLEINIDSAPILVNELNENALNAICSERYDKGSALLLKCQQILEYLHINNCENCAIFELITIHNLALCYQKYLITVFT